MPTPFFACSRCKECLESTSFYRVKHRRLPHCKACQNEAASKRFDDPRKRMWQSSYSNARAKGMKHSIKYKDIPLPEICIYLGVKLDYRRASERGRLRSPNAPSIDRIDSTRGYVRGNVQVISDLANRMKQNATIDQLVAFAEGIIRVHGLL